MIGIFQPWARVGLVLVCLGAGVACLLHVAPPLTLFIHTVATWLLGRHDGYAQAQQGDRA